MYSLTTPQQNIWNLQKFYYNTSIGNICGALLYSESKDNAILEKAINKLIELQEGTRLRFAEENGVPVQYIEEFEYRNIPVKNFSTKSEYDKFVNAFAKVPVGLENRDMLSIYIVNVENYTGFVFKASHLISDAWSFSIFGSKVAEYYDCIINNIAIDDTIISYVEYIDSEQKYLESARYIKDKAFWEEKYSEKPEVSAIKMITTPVTKLDSARKRFDISADITADINNFAACSGISQAVLFETAIIAYLSRINSENKSITIGVPVLNRSSKKEKATVGMYISTTPLTIDISPDDSLLSLAKKITAAHQSIFRHQKYPYSNTLKYIREKHSFEGNLFDVMVSFQNATTNTGEKSEWYGNGYSQTPFEFHIDNRDNADTYTVNIDYQTEVFKQEEEIKLLYNRILFIINQIISTPECALSELNIIPEDEYAKIIYDFNDTAIDYSRDKCVHELFSEQAAKTPDKIALVFEDKQFTYKQLDEMSNSLAHYLREKGVKPNDIVPIISNRSYLAVVAMFGILKAGGAYMPIDPTYPKDRIEYMISDAGSKIALTSGYNETLPVNSVDLEKVCFTENTDAVVNVNTPDDLCYVLFTSGSTGKPKATMLTHQNLCNFIDCNNINNNYQCNMCGDCNTVLAVTTFTFDISVFEIYLSLLNGLKIVLTNNEEDLSAQLLAGLIIKHNIDVIHTTPTKFLMYLNNFEFQSAIRNVKILMIGAEVFTQEIYNTISKYTGATIYNGYGPTETTIGVSFKRIVNSTDITIGKPIANTQIYILDQNKKPLPIGVAGELCISGDGVGKGYLNRPELTAEKFIPNPFYDEKSNPTAGKIMYCTGDLARWRNDGEIEYLGRIDTQVKIRGLRIELGEIESVMSGFDGIHMTAVTDKRDENNRQYLVGYYTADTDIDEKSLRQHLAAKLPKYMVPNYFVCLNEMPMTTSGKIDRKNLPLPDFSVSKEKYVAPETSTEKTIADIWSELLEIDKIGKQDDFFNLDGDSLMSITLLSRLEDKFNVNITMRDIIENSVLEGLADIIDNAEGKQTVIVKTEAEKYILLPQQKAIYAACSKSPDSLAYNMPGRITLSDNIDRERLKNCFEKLIEIHPSLRTYIYSDENEVYGIIDNNAKIAFEQYSDNNFENFARPFDLSKAPLMRVAFTETSMLLDMHHIITDGESLSIILRDLATLYNDGIIAPSDVSYADYSDYYYKNDFTSHKNYYKNMLKCDFEPVILPQKKCLTESIGISAYYTIGAEDFKSAKEYANKNGLTDTMLFLGVFGILLSKYSANNEILSSVVFTNRIHSQIADIAGMFVNTLPLLFSVNGTATEYFSNVKDTVMNLYEYQELPFYDIAEFVGMNDKSVINTSFVYQAGGSKKLKIGKTDFTPQFIDTHTAKFDITFELTPNENGCTVRIEYNSGKYEKEFIDKLFNGYSMILKQLNAENVSDISVLDSEEYNRVIYDFNNTAGDYPRDKCVHELFSEQAKHTPEKIALVFEDKQFTYKQLDEMTNSLADYLRKNGVKPNDIVPIISNRSYLAVVAMFGILKAGGAYMPIDPTYPKDRIEYMISDAGSKIALTSGYNETLPVNSVDLEKFDFAENTDVAVNVNTPDDLCYVIFTSGSTGKPKGAMLTHSGLVNFSNNNNNNNVFQSTVFKNCSTILAIGAFTFDISIVEIFLPLLNGLCTVIANDSLSNNPELLAQEINNQGIDIIHATPTRLSYYLNSSAFASAMSGLNTILTAGESFSPELMEKIRTYSDAKIFNGYGPTETTVGCSFAMVEDVADITIGKPIANTQIYILDQNKKPLPIGVAGELCISGDGVGKGYLNRPKLTAEKFIPNPFIEGKTMYCTGDLARWREDGEIEYLGRIDTQVKIRGLRIELGEIESVMSGFDGIHMTAVTDKRDENNRQYLVGYYTADTDIDEKSLRQHLAAKLPKYMVPNYFVCLNEMPMTASGKTDRKNLPLPDFTVSQEEYVAPETELEKQLCGVLCELFSVEQIGVTDDFFDIGGDSLKAIEYVAKAHTAGVEFALQNVFDYPTVRELCNFLENGAEKVVRYTATDFDKYEEILSRNVIDESFIPEKKSLGNVLLTGATGFLGAHILDELMKNETGIVYCLVRSNSPDDRRGRWPEIIKYYFGDKYNDEIGKRIIPIVGDIVIENLSDNIPDNVQTVIHAAATVKHYGSYEYFKKVNVDGTQNVVNYAKRINAKMIHISTLSVSGNSMADEFDVYRSSELKHFYEYSLFIEQPLENVYIRSKFEAEIAVLNAMLDGLDGKIIRVGNLTNRLSDSKFQPNYESNAFLTRFKAAVELGMFPDYLLPLYAEFSPVDQTAEGVVKIAQYADKQCVFHLNSNRPIYFTRLLEIFKQLKIKMELVSGEVFNNTLQTLAKDSATEYIYEAFQNDMDENGQLVYDSNIRINNDFTDWFMKKLGFEWAKLDIEYIRDYIEYFRSIGYLEA